LPGRLLAVMAVFFGYPRFRLPMQIARSAEGYGLLPSLPE